jgi:creatinine amidohydrolase/Fe(II)-dependent formamide hydrolase-like protein
MANVPNTAQAGSHARVRRMLQLVEDQMVALRKSLVHREHVRAPGQMEDAVRLTVVIEKMARYGQKGTAEDAADAAELIEQLVDDLLASIRSVLAS